MYSCLGSGGAVSSGVWFGGGTECIAVCDVVGLNV
jgi:hypothetical protein